MFPQEPPVGRKSMPVDNAPSSEEAMYYVDFGPFFAREIQKVLRYRQSGMFCELMFWQDEYRF